MDFKRKELSGESLEIALSGILDDIGHTAEQDCEANAKAFDRLYHAFQTQSRTLSLMIKAEGDLNIRNAETIKAIEKDSYIDYENLPPLNPKGLAGLEKRFAHLAYKTEIRRGLPRLPG